MFVYTRYTCCRNESVIKKTALNMSSKGKKLSLAEKISSLVTAAPTVFGSDDENEESKAKVVERYDESGSDDDPTGSTFRKRNVDLLDQVDKRYKGKKVSRKDVYSEESESEMDEEHSSDANEDDSEVEKSSMEEDIGSNSEEYSDDEEDSEVDEDNPLRRNRDKEVNFENIVPATIHADVEKGNCVREQLKIWENLLEIRIKLQKCLITSNQMPQYDVHKQLKSDERFKKEVDNGKNKLTALLDNLLAIQSSLLGNYPETRNLNRGKKRKAQENEEESNDDQMDEEICSDTEDEMDKGAESSEESSGEEKESEAPPGKKKKQSLVEYEKIITENHDAYRNYRNSVIQKWNDKTRVATGSVNKGSSQAIVKQIEFVMSDRSKVLKRTQLKRSEYEILGKDVSSQDEDGRRTQDYDAEIYDDDDFYHQLLRELIEYKSSDITDPIQLSKQWIALQNMRSKMKRKIDTRATKGRRVRYNVHTKLVNFMAPMSTNDTWSDLAKNELYNSLFGKIKSSEVEPVRNNSSDK